MSIKRTLGGDRLGTGKKMQVELHGYQRSSHDLSRIWRSTMSAGTLVPFMTEVGLPGDTFDIDLNAEILTHPTIGPLFGSYKVQLDVFSIPIRLYNSLLHNNALGIGLEMEKVKLPVINLLSKVQATVPDDIDNSQINPSAIMSYLGVRGVGINKDANDTRRAFNAVPLLAYWDIYKQYYSNKQENIGAVVHNEAGTPGGTTVTLVNLIDQLWGAWTIDQTPNTNGPTLSAATKILVAYTGTPPNPANVYLHFQNNGPLNLYQASAGAWNDTGSALEFWWPFAQYGADVMTHFEFMTSTDSVNIHPNVETFDLENIDAMRHAMLAFTSTTAPFDVNGTTLEPYRYVFEENNDVPNLLFAQEGLGLKTYQSDLFNNWLKSEYLTYISNVSSVDTTGDSFTIDQLNLSKKVYDMLNRIAVSGGTYHDWIDSVYDENSRRMAESPMYMGGLIRELVFQEVVSNSEANGQPLGTLAGKGTMSNKKKGGKIVVKVDEPCYIMGIISLTPRLDYSQGNKWDMGLKTLNDLHKPALDEIGFQDLITEQMAWWDTTYNGTTWLQKSAGKQPAWLNYMTAVNETRGNFAKQRDQMFMTLNRRYEYDQATGIRDLTTYIDPTKFNHIFAQTSIDAQNFWAQVGINMFVRRKMSAKIMPNL